MAENGVPKNPKALDEIPFEAINELSKSYDSILASIRRRDGRGLLASIYTKLPFKTIELAAIDGWLNEKAGGGKFEVFVMNPNNPAEMLLRFNVPVEGAPRMPARLDMPDGTPYAPPPQSAAPPWQQPDPHHDAPWGSPAAAGAYPAPGQPYTQQPYPGPGPQPYAPRPRPEPREERPAPGARFSSDQVALQQLAARDAEVARLQRLLEEQARNAANEQLRLRNEAERAKEDARERAHKAEMDALRAEIRAGRGEERGGKGLDLNGVAAVVAAVVPLLAGPRESQTELAKLQMQQQTTLLAQLAAPKKSGAEELLEKYLPIVLPMLKDAITGGKNSSEREMNLIATLAEQQMANLMGMAQIIQELGPGDDHPIAGVIKQGIEGAMAIGQAYIAERQAEAQQAQQRQRQIPAQAVHVEDRRVQQQPQQRAPAQAPQQQPAAQAQPARPAPSVQQPESAHPMLALLPPAFQTVEWRAIVTELLKTPPPDVESMATIIGHHVQHLVVFNIVPPELANVLKDPHGTLGAVLQFLPVNATNPAYVQQLLARTVELLTQAGLISQQPVTAAPVQRPRPAQSAPTAPSAPEDEEDDGEDDEGDDGDDEGIETYPQADA